MMTSTQVAGAAIVDVLPLELLIVDDNAGDVRLTRAALEDAKLNIRVSVARNGEEAMAYLQRTGRFATAKRPDLVLLDINLPRISGLEVLERARTDDALHDLPIIMVTGSDADLDVSTATRWAASAYITKPVRAADVIAAVGAIDPRWVSNASVVGAPVFARVDAKASPDASMIENDPDRPTLLLVEDNPGDAGLVERCLRHELNGRWSCRWVKRMSAALEVLATQAVEIVVLDLNLPDASGISGVERLRAAWPHTPIVVLTGLDDESRAEAAIRAGAQDYLMKDRIDGESLSRAVRYAVERTRAEQAVAHAEWLTNVAETTLAVAHGLNNPLMALLAQIELLNAAAPATDLREALADVTSSARRIADVVRRLASLKDAQTTMYIASSRTLDRSVPSPSDPLGESHHVAT
jgi:chemotaxis family two-component system response regulator Rcp1